MSQKMFTAAQHRQMAADVLANAGKPGNPTAERATQRAINHEIIAKLIEARMRGEPISYSNAPSIVP